MKEKRNALSRVLGRTDVIAIGFGTMVGWSWIMLAASWVNSAGFLGTICAFVLGSCVFIAIGLIYGELAAAMPLAGGEFVFAYRAMGEKAAWIVGWIITMAYIGVAAWEGIAFATAIDYILPLPDAVPLWEIAGYQVYLSWSVVGMAGALIICLLNFFGARPAVMFQVLATAVLMVVVLTFFFGSLSFGGRENIGRLFESLDGFSYVLLMVPAMLIGFGTIAQSAEEMNIEPKSTGKMILVCMIMSVVWYLILISGIALAAPMEIRGSGDIPMADIVAYLFNGEPFAVMIVMGGIFGILTSWNGFFIGATRLIFAMGRAKILPEVFGKLHKKYRTPWAAILLVGGICVFAPFLGMNALEWFVDTSSFCTLFVCIFVVIAFMLLRKNEAGLSRPFDIHMGKGFVFGVVMLVITLAYFGFYMWKNLDPMSPSPEFIIALLWVLLGLLMIGIRMIKREPVSGEERELLVFGERLARKGAGNEK